MTDREQPHRQQIDHYRIDPLGKRDMGADCQICNPNLLDELSELMFAMEGITE